MLRIVPRPSTSDEIAHNPKGDRSPLLLSTSLSALRSISLLISTAGLAKPKQ